MPWEVISELTVNSILSTWTIADGAKSAIIGQDSGVVTGGEVSSWVSCDNSLFAIPISQSVYDVDLSDGLHITRDSNGTIYAILNNVVVGNITGQTSTIDSWAYWVFIVDRENEVACVVQTKYYYWSYNNRFEWVTIGTKASPSNALYNWITQHEIPPIVYNWQSVPSVSGKNGILSLTHVRNDSLLDGGSQTFTPEQVFVSEQSRVGRLMANVPIGTAIKAIFSGVNFLGIRKDTATTNTVRMVLTEHIQREIFQSSFITDKCYIGFIMDAEQTAGRIGIFFPQYDPLTEILTGYSVNFTDTDYSETDVYNWLLVGKW